jgi:hypothetical protein
MEDAVVKKFWKHVQKGEKPWECWNWTGARNSVNGSLLIRCGQKCYIAKKISLQIANKTVTKRVGYICQNAMCVNPDHLVSGDIERFWSKVIKLSNRCWEWIGQTRGSGPKQQYGVIHLRGDGKNKYASAHKFSWELHMGRKVPKPMVVCHKCDNTRCVNPDHLFIGSTLDNNQDRHQKDRDAKGEKHGRAKITEINVIEARERYSKGESIASLARVFNVSWGIIEQAVKRKTWKHVL